MSAYPFQSTEALHGFEDTSGHPPSIICPTGQRVTFAFAAYDCTARG
jgi:hypothetical protein